MENESRKLDRSIEIMKLLAEGINPFTNEPYDDKAFVNDPRMVRCFYYVIDVLERVKTGRIGGASGRRDMPFVITPEEKRKIVLPDEKIGVNTFAKCVNLVIDPSRSKRLTGMLINQQLKKMGILAEEKEADGKSHTVITGESARYGIESMQMDYNGVVYNKVVFNDQGKKFLLEHLEEIMSYK